MPIYRMTKEEVEKRKLLVKDEQAKLKKYKKIAASKAMVKKELIKELDDVDQQLNAWLKKKDDENKKLRKFLDKKVKKKRKKINT